MHIAITIDWNALMVSVQMPSLIKRKTYDSVGSICIDGPRLPKDNEKTKITL